MMLAKVFVVATLVLSACGGGGKRPAVIGSGGGEPMAATVPGLRDGALWSCQIADYDPQPCKVSAVEGGWRLAKLLGSQRFRGTLIEQGAGLGFRGDFFCPWGACDAPMAVEFGPDPASGGFVTEFGGDAVRMRYDEQLEGEWGGAGYGGLTGDEQ